MEGAKPGHTVEFHGLKGAAHLNGTKGTLVQLFTRGEAKGRWEVRCAVDQKKVNAKPENLCLVGVRQKPRQVARQGPTRMGFPTAGHGAPGVLPSNNAWAQGFPTADQYEWLSNCYQMRCDDDYQWGGGYLHGPYEPNATPLSIETDFVAFCVLAKRRGVLPENWDWSAFLRVAAQHVAFAFEKSDAKQRWGGENYFAASMGGRSLRYTGECVYGSRVDTPQTSEVARAIAREVSTNKLELQEKDLGGGKVWERFVSDLAAGSRFSG